MPSTRLHKHYVDTSRGQLHVQQAGTSGPALVLVSLTSFASPLLDTVLPSLADHGWQAFGIDLMGYGRSDKRQARQARPAGATDQADWLVEDFADNLLEALFALGVAPFGLVCGHFSCWTGVEIASRSPAALPGLRGLVLDGSPRYTPEQRAEMQAAGPPAPQAWDEQGTHALAYWHKVWRILHRLDPERALDAVPTQRFREAVMCLLEASVYEPNTAMAAAHFELESRLPRVALPTLVMCSDTDWNLPHHEAIVSALPRAQPLRLAGVNPLHHLSAAGRGAEYAGHLHRFFAAL